jgi:UMP-CMP kinase
MKLTGSYLFMAAATYRCSLAWTSHFASRGIRPTTSTGARGARIQQSASFLSSTTTTIRAADFYGVRGGGSILHSEAPAAKSVGSTTTSGTAAAAVPPIDATELEALARPRPTHRFGGLRYCDLGDLFRVVFVLGGPGAGKGTQSNLIEAHYPVCHLSVGELLRNVPETSPHRDLIADALVAGRIVPVEISLSLLRSAMEEQAEARGRETIFLVDGFPRNFDNLSGWSRIMSDVSAIASVLVYQCPLPVLEARIVERGRESGRSDDNLESAKKRFTTFEKDTVPVIEALQMVSTSSTSTGDDEGKEGGTNWRVVYIRGDQSLEAVWLDTQQVVNQLIVNDVLRANAALLRAVQEGNVDAYRNVCDSEWFSNDVDPTEVMRRQEGEPAEGAGQVDSAQVDVISGTHVAVSYDRVMQGQLLREKRIWSHKGELGWRNVHFARIPSQDRP